MAAPARSRPPAHKAPEHRYPGRVWPACQASLASLHDAEYFPIPRDELCLSRGIFLPGRCPGTGDQEGWLQYQWCCFL